MFTAESLPILKPVGSTTGSRRPGPARHGPHPERKQSLPVSQGDPIHEFYLPRRRLPRATYAARTRSQTKLVLWVHREEEEKEFFTRIITEGEEGGSQPPADLAALGGAHPRYIRSHTRTEPATARAEAMGEVSEAGDDASVSLPRPRSPPASPKASSS